MFQEIWSKYLAPSKSDFVLRFLQTNIFLSNIRHCTFHFEFPFVRKWKLIVHLLFMEKALVGKNPWKVVLFIIIHFEAVFLLPGINHWKRESWIDIYPYEWWKQRQSSNYKQKLGMYWGFLLLFCLIRPLDKSTCK